MCTPILSKNKLSSKRLATGTVTHVKIKKKNKTLCTKIAT